MRSLTPTPSSMSSMDNDAVTILGPKLRAAIYLLLITVSAVLTPLMAAGVVPSLYGAIVQSLMGVFGGATALANIKQRPVYEARHDNDDEIQIVGHE